MADELPPEFYDLADRFIELANELTRIQGPQRISAVMLFAAARFNAHCLFAVDSEAVKNREQAVSYFVGQYRSMLEDNVEEFLRSQRDLNTSEE